MKKTIFLAAIACVALAGCTKNERIADIARDGVDVPLSFSPITNPATRAVAGEMPTAYNTGESFIAFAGWTAGDYAGSTGVTEFFVNNLTTAICSYDATWTCWKPVVTYYWPKTGKLTFEALSPADVQYHAAAIGHTWAVGVTLDDFAVRGGIKDQYDLLYSSREFNKVRSLYTPAADADPSDPYDEKSGDAGSYKGVDLFFHHALSSIVFKVKTKADYSSNATITLTGLTINNAYSTGDFTQGGNDGASAAAWSQTPAWSNQTAAVDYSVFSGSQTVTSSSAAVSPLVGSASNIILLPQNLEHTSATDNVTVTVTYTVAQNGGSALPQTAVIKLKDLTASSSAITKWEMSKRYTYTIVFGLDEIYFDPRVEDWTPVNMDEYVIKESDV